MVDGEPQIRIHRCRLDDHCTPEREICRFGPVWRQRVTDQILIETWPKSYIDTTSPCQLNRIASRQVVAQACERLKGTHLKFWLNLCPYTNHTLQHFQHSWGRPGTLPTSISSRDTISARVKTSSPKHLFQLAISLWYQLCLSKQADFRNRGRDSPGLGLEDASSVLGIMQAIGQNLYRA